MRALCCALAILAGAAMIGDIDAAQAERKSLPSPSCQVLTKDIASVKIGNISQAPDISNVLSFTCSIGRPLDPGRRAVYCWHIHDAPGGTARFTYRYAKYDINPKITIGFNIYSHGLKVGDRRTLYNITGEVTEWTSDTSFRVDDPILVRWEGNEGGFLPPGHYRYNNPKTHFTAFDIADTDDITYANACGSTSGDISGNAKRRHQYHRQCPDLLPGQGR